MRERTAPLLNRPALALLLCAVAAPLPAPAREPAPPPPERPHYRIPRAAGPIAVDGVLDELAWRSALVVEVPYEIQPGENVPAPVETEALLTYDSAHLYLAFRAHDPEPAAIRAHLSDRDEAFEDDFVGVILDTFNDERRAFEFFINPIGVQMDLIRNDTGTAEEEDPAWDAIWDSRGRITPEGYVVEVAIPFTSLTFQRRDGEQTWGLFVFRSYPRGDRHQLFNVPNDRNLNCFLCQGAKLTGFAGAEPGRNLELDPTVTAERTDSRPELAGGGLASGEAEAEAGLTALWGVTPNLTFSATLNPDFSQVEADAAQLDVNNQFALFFPEKRPFFLEGADFFDTFLRTVYTRNVADPSWGLKLTGKEGAHAVGVFVAQDEVTNLLVPGSRFSDVTTLEQESLDAVVRYRRDFGGSSTVGFLYTGREGDGYHNRLAGADANYRFTDTDSFRVQVLGSQTVYPRSVVDGLGQPAGTLEDTALEARYIHSSRSWFGAVEVRDVGRDFRADMGFIPRVGYREAELIAERKWWGEAGDWYNRIEAGGAWEASEDSSGEPLERDLALWVNLNGPYQSFVRLSPHVRQRTFDGVELDETFVSFYGEIQPTGSFSAGLEARAGDDVDVEGRRSAETVLLWPWTQVRLGRHLRLEASHLHQRLDVEAGRLFTANLSEVKAVYQLNVRTFLRALAQVEDIERDPALYDDEVDAESRELFTQLLFSYKLNPQTVFFVGYSDRYQGTQATRLTQTERTFFLKVGYAWVF